MVACFLTPIYTSSEKKGLENTVYKVELGYQFPYEVKQKF